MEFSWSRDQIELKDAVQDFAREALNDSVAEDDRLSTFPHEKWKASAEFGILGLPMPEEFGGSGLDLLSTVYAMEGLGYGCTDNGLLFGLNAQLWSVQAPILRFGSPGQKEAYLPKLIGGEWIGAHGMTEPGSGSDSFAMSTTAERDGSGGYILNGGKTFITSAPVADLFLIFASVSRARGFLGVTAFLVEKGAPGLEVGRPMEKMGLRSSPLAEVFLENCRVEPEQRLGKEGNGGAIFRHSMALERCCILASCVGTMQRQLEACIQHARTRQQFGKPLGAFQAVSHRIVDMKVHLEAARLLLYKAAWLRSHGGEAGEEIAAAKLYLSEAFVRSSLDTLHLHGGYGYSTEAQIERDLRDAVGSRIYSGTSEIQKELIARGMGL